MTSSSEDMLALAERVEQATGPDRELEHEIGRLAHPNAMITREYTASLDAAMTLLPGKDWEFSLEWESGSLLFHPDAEMFGRAMIGDPRLRMEAEALTLPLALCAAALRAHQQGEGR